MMAQGGGAAFTEENSNFFRYSTLLVDLGAEILQEVLKSYHAPGDLKSFLKRNKTILTSLPKNVLGTEQQRLLFPSQGDPDVSSFDITLLCTLLRNLHNTIPAKDSVWTKAAATDTSVAADVGRIRQARNRLHGHMASTSLGKLQYLNEKRTLTQIYCRIVQNLSFPALTLTSSKVREKVKAIEEAPLEAEKQQEILSRLNLWYTLDIPEELSKIREGVEVSTNLMKEVKTGVEKLQEHLQKESSARSRGQREQSKTLSKVVDVHSEIKALSRKVDQLVLDTDSPASVVDEKLLLKRIARTKNLLQDHMLRKGDVFVESRAYVEALSVLKKKRCLTIAGIPGAGKTFMALTLMAEMVSGDPEMKPIQVDNAEEWMDLVDPSRKLCAMVDDCLGKYGLDERELKGWQSVSNPILDCVRKGNVFVLMTVRQNVLKDATSVKNLEELGISRNELPSFLKAEYVVDLSSIDLQLTPSERKRMLEKYQHLYQLSIEANEIAKICDQVNVIGFPQSCRMLGSVTEKAEPSKIFQEPGQYLLREVECVFAEDKLKYAVLVLALLFGGEFTTDILEKENERVKSILSVCGIGSQKLLNIADVALKLCGEFLSSNKAQDCFSFSHDTIHEAVFKSVAKRFPQSTLELCALDIISKLCYGEDQHKDTSTGHWQQFIVDARKFTILMKRFEDGLCSKQGATMQLVLAAKIWASSSFVSSFFKTVLEENKFQTMLSLVDEAGSCALKHAVKAGNYNFIQETVKHIFAKKLNTKDMDHKLQMTVREACKCGETDIVSLLLEKVVPELISLKDAAHSGNVDIIKMLLNYQNGILVPRLKKNMKVELAEIACRNGKFQMVFYLLEKWPEAFEESGHKLLRAAVSGGELQVVRYLVERGVYEAQKVGSENAVFIDVCRTGREDILRYLVSVCPKTILSLDKIQLLHSAACGGNVSLIKYLISLGLDLVNTKTKDENSHNVLQTAILGGHFEMVKFLCEMEPKLLLEVDNNQLNTLHMAAASGNTNIFRFLVNEGFDVLSKGGKGRTVLHEACLYRQIEMVQHIVSAYPYLCHEMDNDDLSPLHYATATCGVDTFECLVDAGSDVFHVGGFQRSVLHTACKEGELAVVRHIIKHYPSLVNAGSCFKPLHLVENVDVLKCLLENGADIMAETDFGYNVLHTACHIGNLNIVKYVVEKYPELAQKRSTSFELPLDLSEMKGNKAVFDFLVLCGCYPEYRSDTGACPLHLSCKKRDLERVKFWANEHPDMLQEVTMCKYTPLHYAVMGGEKSVVDFLVKEKGADLHAVTASNEDVIGIAQRFGHKELEGHLIELLKDRFDGDDAYFF